MYDYILEEMAHLLAEKQMLATGISDVDVVKLYKEYWRDKVAIVWTAEDVKSTAEYMDVELSEEQIDSVLFYMHNKHDATLGVTWDVIEELIRWEVSKNADVQEKGAGDSE